MAVSSTRWCTWDAARRLQALQDATSELTATRRMLLFCTVASRASRYPHLAELLAENGAGALASIPLLAGDRVLGAIGINWSEDRAFTHDERTSSASGSTSSISHR